ncbi:MAG TPA: MotA/TolQ/ExbB proton channel family protein [Terrimicrobiaceae bacterium]|nr:MotA/TolQ/ExbB proton channel family protein [Terrimicrobiaceae bacterium]
MDSLIALPLGEGLVYSFLEATIEGKIVLLVLFLCSIFSWSVMVTKIRYLNFAKRQSERFSALFRRDRAPLRIYEQGIRFEGSPLYDIYKAGCAELCFQLLGSSDIDQTFHGRLEAAERITSAQMRALTAVMERAVGEAGLKLESQMIILSTAVSGAPFLGLLGTVWGVMDAFGGIARTGSANLAAMAPGVAGALITTVFGLLVAIPAMFGYNFLVTSVRAMIVQAENFAGELASEFEHRFVEHGSADQRRHLV